MSGAYRFTAYVPVIRRSYHIWLKQSCERRPSIDSYPIYSVPLVCCGLIAPAPPERPPPLPPPQFPEPINAECQHWECGCQQQYFFCQLPWWLCLVVLILLLILICLFLCAAALCLLRKRNRIYATHKETKADESTNIGGFGTTTCQSSSHAYPHVFTVDSVTQTPPERKQVEQQVNYHHYNHGYMPWNDKRTPSAENHASIPLRDVKPGGYARREDGWNGISRRTPVENDRQPWIFDRWEEHEEITEEIISYG